MNGIVLIGRPGSGKSTIGKMIAEMLKMDYISSGDIARSMGDSVILDLTEGRMAPEEAMMKEIRNIVEHNSNNIILDGFPRTIEQFTYLRLLNPSMTYVYIDADPHTCFDRMIARGRFDDTTDAVLRRIRNYKEHTELILSRIDVTIRVNNSGIIDPRVLANKISNIWR